eukprot:6204959-Pleurochrysis_carterae.AAC.1
MSLGMVFSEYAAKMIERTPMRTARSKYEVGLTYILYTFGRSSSNQPHPCKAVLHARKNAEVRVTAPHTVQAIFKCPEPHPARAATSRLNFAPLLLLIYAFRVNSAGTALIDHHHGMSRTHYPVLSTDASPKKAC